MMDKIFQVFNGGSLLFGVDAFTYKIYMGISPSTPRWAKAFP